MTTIKQVLRYLKGTLDLGLRFDKEGESPKLVSYSDNDLARDLEDRKSTTEILFYLGLCLVNWSSQKQKFLALSSCEAEYIALTATVCQGVWLTRFLGELDG